MTAQPAYVPTAIERTAPLVDLTAPDPVDARRATRQLLLDGGLSHDAEEGLVGAVSEVVTNADLHGRPPVRVRGWMIDGEAVITVTDHGPGPSDPEAGMRPATRGQGEGGFGLWLAHQLCDEVVMGCDHDLFTVRLVARSPRPA